MADPKPEQVSYSLALWLDMFSKAAANEKPVIAAQWMAAYLESAHQPMRY
jgi:hypothetical protein